MTTVTVVVGVDMLSGVDVTALVAVEINLGFTVDTMIDALACVFADTTTSVVIDVEVGVDMLFADASANAVTAVMADLEFTMSASRE